MTAVAAAGVEEGADDDEPSGELDDRADLEENPEVYQKEETVDTH